MHCHMLRIRGNAIHSRLVAFIVTDTVIIVVRDTSGGTVLDLKHIPFRVDLGRFS